MLRQVGWVDRISRQVRFKKLVGNVCYFSGNVDVFKMKHSLGMFSFVFCSFKKHTIKLFNSEKNISDLHFKTFFGGGEMSKM